MDSTTKTRLAELSGEIIKAYHLGDTGKGAALAAEAIRLHLTVELPQFSDFVDSVAERMRTNPGQTYGLDDKSAVEVFGQLSQIGQRSAVSLLFHVVAERAKQINEAKPLGGEVAEEPAPAKE